MQELQRSSARAVGVAFTDETGPSNTITDVPGVAVGHATLSEGDIQTGVTALFPRGVTDLEPVAAAIFSLNGTGEFTQAHSIDELGMLQGPLMLTNTMAVGTVHSATARWLIENDPDCKWALPAVAETWDGHLNNINAFPIEERHVLEAIATSTHNPVPQGCVGAGTGTVAFGFKGGIGSSSRIVRDDNDHYTVGVLVQSNCGAREQLQIAGINIANLLDASPQPVVRDGGSIIIAVGTDAPLHVHELRRVVKRAALGLARTGSSAAPQSGDIFLAFSTRPPHRPPTQPHTPPDQQSDDPFLREIFRVTVSATEEAIVNSLTYATTTTGYRGNTVEALPLDLVQAAFQSQR